MMNMKQLLAVTGVAGVMILTVAGCDQQAPTDPASEHVDSATQSQEFGGSASGSMGGGSTMDSGTAPQSTTDSFGDQVDEAGSSLQDTADEMEQGLDEAGDAMDDAADDLGDELEDAGEQAADEAEEALPQ